MASEMTSLGKVGILNKNAYDAAVAYKEGEFVLYLGSTYIALKDLTAGMTPTNDMINWMYLAQGASAEAVLASLAAVESSATASRAYAAGDYMLYNSQLYKATAAIASGDTLAAGTNITQAVMGEDVAAFARALNSMAASLAPVETTTTASKAYAVGEYLMLANQLYKVTAAIASGGTLSVGTNISAVTAGGELTAIKESLTYKSGDYVSVAGSSSQLLVGGTMGGSGTAFFTISLGKPIASSATPTLRSGATVNIRYNGNTITTTDLVIQYIHKGTGCLTLRATPSSTISNNTPVGIVSNSLIIDFT